MLLQKPRWKHLISTSRRLRSVVKMVSIAKMLSLVYGGLSPVPFTFLTGVLIDDEDGQPWIFDWDRHAEVQGVSWNGADDGNSLSGSWAWNHSDDRSHECRLALAVSVSYRHHCR